MMYKEIRKIKALLEEGVNVMEYFRKQDNRTDNSSEAIKISYDLQAGSYIESLKDNQVFNTNYTTALAAIIDKLGTLNSICEIGVGEATTLANMVTKMKQKPEYMLGFDISWSRISYARGFVKQKGISGDGLFIGDLFHIPLADQCVDVVYTSHSLQPNGGREKEALQELFRIASRYVVLLEPAYELANKEAQHRMEHHGYVRGLKSAAEQLGYHVTEYRLFDYSVNPLNPTGLMIIEKNAVAPAKTPNYACPITGALLKKTDDCYFADESLLAYPIIGGIPCLLPENAILATKFNEALE